MSNNTIEPLNLTMFFTAGVSLEAWSKTGNLERELELYHRIAGHLSKVNLLTYGGKADRKFRAQLGSLGLLPAKWYSRQQLTALGIAAKFSPQLLATDVFKTNQIRGAQVPIWLKKIYRKKLIVRCGFLHGFFTRQQTADPQRILDAVTLEKTAFEQADLSIVTSFWQKQLVIDDYGLPPEKIKVIPNYVVTDIFKPDPSISSKYDLIFVGRNHSQKNLNNLLEALKLLKARRKSYSLNLVGGCCGDPDLRRQAEGLEVTFSGSLSTKKLPGALNEAKVFVLPSHYEGHPKALLEAMSCGLPCIGTEVLGIKEDIRHMHNGYLCNTDSASIAQAIETVCDSDDIRTTLGRNARKYIAENYDIDKIVELELEALKDIQLF